MFTDRQVKWRVNWFNEVKIPMLTAAVLSDKGLQSLQSKIDQYNIIVDQEFKVPPGKAKILTPEEEFMYITLRSNFVHGKAKILIYKILKENKGLSVTQLFGMMLFRLKREHPQVVEQMMKEGLL